jgi:hypothetical protein
MPSAAVTEHAGRARGAAALLLVSWAVLSTGPAVAAPSAEQRSAAEALFQQGRELMSQKAFAAACEKFAGSQELDPGLGTQLHLADCYDLAGKTASAWALFREAASVARRSGEVDRQRIAEERAENLVPRLSKLELHVSPANAGPGFELRLNDVLIPRASWNTALPIDPGPLRVEARAPGKQPWRYRGALPPGPVSRRIEIPALRAAPPQAPTAGAASPVAAAKLAAPSSAQRTAGYITTATGIVALTVGGLFGYRAYALNQRSKGQCRDEDPTACTQQGVGLRDDAKRMSTVSTITSIAGGVLVVGGVALVLTAPSASHGEHVAVRSASLSGFRLGVQGVW